MLAVIPPSEDIRGEHGGGGGGGNHAVLGGDTQRRVELDEKVLDSSDDEADEAGKADTRASAARVNTHV